MKSARQANYSLAPLERSSERAGGDATLMTPRVDRVANDDDDRARAHDRSANDQKQKLFETRESSENFDFVINFRIATTGYNVVLFSFFVRMMFLG